MRDQKQGGGAGPSREPRRDQKLRTAVQTAISEVHKFAWQWRLLCCLTSTEAG